MRGRRSRRATARARRFATRSERRLGFRDGQSVLAWLVSSILPSVMTTMSPTLVAPNSFFAKAVGTPMQPWVALPHLTSLP